MEFIKQSNASPTGSVYNAKYTTVGIFQVQATTFCSHQHVRYRMPAHTNTKTVHPVLHPKHTNTKTCRYQDKPTWEERCVEVGWGLGKDVAHRIDLTRHRLVIECWEQDSIQRSGEKRLMKSEQTLFSRQTVMITIYSLRSD
jgi:hypothetical protein